MAEQRDGGVSAGSVSAGAGPASGDVHDTSLAGSTAAHHHSGTGPAIALTDDTATETSAVVETIVDAPIADGTDNGSAPVDTGTSGETPAADAHAETPAPEIAGITETPAREDAGIAETPVSGSAAGTGAGAAESSDAAPDAADATSVRGADSGAAAGAAGGRTYGRTGESGGKREESADLDPQEVVAPIRQRRDQSAPADRRRADPEQILAAYPWMFDPATLREQVDEPERLWDVADRLTDRLEFAERDNVRAGLLSLRAVVSRVLGELDDALADGREALRHAEASGEARSVSVAQARLAHVLQWRGEFDEADRLYARADSAELPARLRAEIRELAGRSAYEQGRFLEAVNHFEQALDLCQGGDPELVERIELALDVISRRSGDDGWGPYPRRREELLSLPAAPLLLPDEGAGLWGYAAAVEPRYAQAQPFSEGVAWVRRPESPAWELIGPGGEVLIGADSGYLAADRFSEGLAWVTRDAEGGWFAIDRENRLIVPGGFEDVRPFRRGLAFFRRSGWGAIDRHGRIVVQPKWRQVSTVLSTGGPIDGFSDEGFAVVDGGAGFGVIDRTGQQVITPAHKAVVIHPSAFLIADEAGRWGALDRQGRPLVETRYVERAEAIDEVRRLLPDVRPVL
ncbi:tetratricopeptide repeat protein [Actinoplanes sp. L3-i22]|uniref:WG repeat-containing protein n=1 Tax=Actinoplanes sp. L3-i22 TaxID=2836373 RepID=UPI001C860F24|nr:tetratricopeptide repeat protein [Actinoplanes sp. L3-i22]